MKAEIDMKLDTLTRISDKMMWYRYIVKNIAFKGDVFNKDAIEVWLEYLSKREANRSVL
jgi:hypothetical protein